MQQDSFSPLEPSANDQVHSGSAVEISPPGGAGENDDKDVTIEVTDGGLQSYFQRIQKYAMLGANEEFILAKEWTATKNPEAVKKLITSHLRLVAKIAGGYKGYGLPLNDLIAEGNVGMMQALKKFDPEKGYRFSTYAMWWIRAAIQEYVLQSWSMVKVGSTASQKKLFFNLRRLKNQLRKMEGTHGALVPHEAKEIADTLNVGEKEVMEMDQRLHGGDLSLNAPLKQGEDATTEWQDWIPDQASENMEARMLDQHEHESRLHMLQESFAKLTPREVEILKYRRLTEPPMTLEELSAKYKISRERVRQLEMAAFHKLRAELHRQVAV